MKNTQTNVTTWGDDPELSGPRDWFRNTLLVRQVRKSKKEGTVLDFGCGSGNLLTRLGKHNYRGVGVDASPLAIAYAKKQAKKAGVKSRISFKVGTEEDLLSMKKQFAIVTAGECLEHIEDDKKVVKRLYRLLEKDGVCVISVPAHQYLWNKTDDYAGHLRRYERKDLIVLFEAAGFQAVKATYYGYPLIYLWHTYVWAPLFIRKMQERKVYSGSPGVLGKVLGSNAIKKLASTVFWFDELFNWTNKGYGLILTARK